MTNATIAWTPARSRTVAPRIWDPFLASRGIPQSLFEAAPLAFPAKSSAALLDYTLDLSAWLRDAGDGLATADAPSLTRTQAANDLGVVWSTISGPGVTMALSGGVPDTTYTLGLQVTTQLGRVGYWSVQLTVDSSSPATAPAGPTNPPGVAFLPDGTALFVPSGLPTGAMQIPGAAYLNGGVLTTDAAPDGSVAAVPNYDFANLPTADPGVAGRLWSQNGPVAISEGPMPPVTPLDTYFYGLPTADPLVPNAPWNNGGYLTFSAGS